MRVVNWISKGHCFSFASLHLTSLHGGNMLKFISSYFDVCILILTSRKRILLTDAVNFSIK